MSPPKKRGFFSHSALSLIVALDVFLTAQAARCELPTCPGPDASWSDTEQGVFKSACAPESTEGFRCRGLLPLSAT